MPLPEDQAFDADGVLCRPGAQHPGQQRRRNLVADKSGDADHDRKPGDRLENAGTHRMQRRRGRGRESAVVEAEQMNPASTQ